MPLKSGQGSVRYNVEELMGSPIRSKSRRKALKTISKKYHLTPKAARMKQALAIAFHKAQQ